MIVRTTTGTRAHPTEPVTTLAELTTEAAQRQCDNFNAKAEALGINTRYITSNA